MKTIFAREACGQIHQASLAQLLFRRECRARQAAQFHSQLACRVFSRVSFRVLASPIFDFLTRGRTSMFGMLELNFLN